MTPHCNTMDGPVVNAAELALEMENINYILPFVKKEDEKELRNAFEKVLSIREINEYTADVADYWFFETAVRLHRKGEGKEYNGLKPAGLDWGPIIRRAEKALKDEDLTDMFEFISAALENQLRIRFEDALNKKDYELNDVEDARDYTEAMLEFVLYSQKTYNCIVNQKLIK